MKGLYRITNAKALRSAFKLRTMKRPQKTPRACTGIAMFVMLSSFATQISFAAR